MRNLDEILDNPKITAVSCVPGKGLTGFVRLIRSGRPRNYSLVIGCDEEGMEHASISCMDMSHIPGWEELCELKDIVWKDEEECYQVFPKKSQYVNIMENCMHIWRNK